MATPPGTLSPAKTTGVLPLPGRRPARLIVAIISIPVLTYLTGYAIIRANSTRTIFSGPCVSRAALALPDWEILRPEGFLDHLYQPVYHLESSFSGRSILWRHGLVGLP